MKFFIKQFQKIKITYSNAWKKNIAKEQDKRLVEKNQKKDGTFRRKLQKNCRMWPMERPNCMMSSQNYRIIREHHYCNTHQLLLDYTLNICGLSTTKVSFTKVMSYQ